MTFETFVQDMLARFPFLREECSAYMDDEEPLAYIAFGCVLTPWLERCLETRDIANIIKICQFFEASAVDSRSDERLSDLIAIELGEWLPGLQESNLLLSHLGHETQRVCSYHISRLDS
jgi:hypothetical protein